MRPAVESPLSSNIPDSPVLFLSPFLAIGLYPIYSERQLGNVGLDGSVGREARWKVPRVEGSRSTPS